MVMDVKETERGGGVRRSCLDWKFSKFRERKNREIFLGILILSSTRKRTNYKVNLFLFLKQ